MAGRDGADEVIAVGATRAGMDIDGGGSEDGDLAAVALVETDPEVLAEGLADGLTGWLTTKGGGWTPYVPQIAAWSKLQCDVPSLAFSFPCLDTCPATWPPPPQAPRF